MSKVVMDIYSLLLFAEDCRHGREPNLGTWHTIENIILCDQIIVDGDGAAKLGIKDFLKNIYPGAFSFSDLLANTQWQFTDYDRQMEIIHSDDRNREPMQSFLERAVGYLDAAQRLGVYWSLHPNRSDYLKKAIDVAPMAPAASRLVDHLDKKMSQSDAGTFVGFDVKVPPVVDLVSSLRAQHRFTLDEAIYHVRNTDRAQQFRQWAGQLDEALRIQSRTSVQPVQRALDEIDQLGEEWTKDLDSGVRYKKRKISLRKLPWGIGTLLGAIGSADFTVKDPLLTSKGTHLLFLNDLYRR